jgi:hypothetical protein
MKFSEVVRQTTAWLQREGRVSYRALKREFDLEDDVLEDLKEELITVKEVATDKDGKMLVWAGAAPAQSPESRVPSPESSAGATAGLSSSAVAYIRPPVSYTPVHLAERIRAVTVNSGERKTITAVFADLKGSTALIEGLDPEEAQQVIDPALQLMMDAVHQSPPRREGVAATACRYWPTISLESDPPGDCPA